MWVRNFTIVEICKPGGFPRGSRDLTVVLGVEVDRGELLERCED